jgi:hypothetical protein
LHGYWLGLEEAPSIHQQLLEEVSPDTVSGASIESSDSTQDALTARIEYILGRLKEKRALAGINMYDEPHRGLFGRLEFARRSNAFLLCTLAASFSPT